MLDNFCTSYLPLTMVSETLTLVSTSETSLGIGKPFPTQLSSQKEMFLLFPTDHFEFCSSNSLLLRTHFQMGELFLFTRQNLGFFTILYFCFRTFVQRGCYSLATLHPILLLRALLLCLVALVELISVLLLICFGLLNSID